MADIDDDVPGMLALQNRAEAGEWPHTMDAQVWARKWLEITEDKPEVAADEGAMIGWFANAIMAGYDTAMLRNANVSRIAELESQPADQYAADLVEIDGHTYGLRPGAARVVREAMASSDPYLDGTDNAHPAWWRGYDYGFIGAVSGLNRILDGKDDGRGVANEPWQSVRTRLREAMRDAGRIDWIARMSKTSTVYMDNQHPWNVAGNYRFNNLRGQTFRDAIDAAMAKDGA